MIAGTTAIAVDLTPSGHVDSSIVGIAAMSVGTTVQMELYHAKIRTMSKSFERRGVQHFLLGTLFCCIISFLNTTRRKKYCIIYADEKKTEEKIVKKIYISGPDVFAPDCAARGEYMKKLCREHNCIGLYPLDNTTSDPTEIFIGNVSMIDEADVVIANLNPFRGDEPDSGTVFEVGYAFAKRKEIWGYLSDISTMQERLGTQDKDGNSVENFGYPLNLMLAKSVHLVQGDFVDCLEAYSRT